MAALWRLSGADGLPWGAVPGEVKLEELSLEDDLEKYPLCETLLSEDSAALKYCLNGSTCRIGPGPEDHLQIVCDCSVIATQDYFFAGPQCATKVMRTYRTQKARNLDSTVQVVNTCFLEDVLGMNQWKNDVATVGHLPL
ncbi:uncharacterized protein BcabD6B2_03660 [Babesia caballi]|uniref:Transmembrane protein, putative n=1 Tax=Babesia caballi TaxID=5871 RepID=A0AAV4LLR9_BABCB|nr:transmembrane protein, putative [Babesia caballi]